MNDSEIESIIADGSISHFCNLSKNPVKNKHDLQEFNFTEKKETLNKAAREEFIEFIAQTSMAKFKNGKDIRQFSVSGLPLYWLTEYSAKHPYNHYLYSVFLLKSLLIEGVVDEKGIIIYCPPKFYFLKSLLCGLFSMNTLRVYKQTNSIFLDYIRFFKTNFKLIIKIIRQGSLQKFEKKGVEKEIVFFSKLNKSSYVNRVVEVFDKEKVIPKSSVAELDINAWISNDKMDESLLSSRPTILQLWFAVVQLLSVKVRLKKEQITINGAVYDSDFIISEINDTIVNRPYHVYSYLWLKNFFINYTVNLTAIYEDEFYVSGRVISAAKKNSNNGLVTTYGMQHGMFSDNHTVYNISDNEINSTSTSSRNGIPLPDFFITWGSYFSNFFLRHNSLTKEFVREFGNPLYVFNTQDLSSNKVVDNPNQIKVLYCLTSSKLFYEELEIVNKILEKNKNISVTIRFHPSFIFSVDQSLFKNSSSIKFSTRKSLSQDLLESNFVLISAHSTIFMDALVVGKPVIRLRTSIHDSTMDKIYKNCLTIDANYKESLILNEMFKISVAGIKNEEFLQLKLNRWLEFFISNGNKTQQKNLGKSV